MSDHKQGVISNKDLESKANQPVYQMITSLEQRKSLIKPRVVKDPQKFNPSDLEALYKVVIIGESDVGKTSLLLRYSDDIFN